MVDAYSMTRLGARIDTFFINYYYVASNGRIVHVDYRGLFDTFSFRVFQFFAVKSRRGLIYRVRYEGFRIDFLIIIDMCRVIIVRLARIQIFFTKDRYGSHRWGEGWFLRVFCGI